MPELAQMQKKTQRGQMVATKKPEQAPLSSAVNTHLAQQAMGNQALQRMLRSGVIQAKLKIGEPDDEYEREADRVAERVMLMAEPSAQVGAVVSGQVQSNPIQQVCPECEEEEEESFQARVVPGRTPEVTMELESHLKAIRGGGRSLPESVRAFFEPRFGYDFSRVRIHTDARAAESTREVNAVAYTMGQDVVFGARQYAPETVAGKRLLAHELTHVVQQQRTAPSGPGVSSVIQLQPVNCTPPITGVAPPRDPTQEVIEAHNLAVVWARLARDQVVAVQGGGHVPLFVQPSLDFHFATPSAANITTIRKRFGGIIARLGRGTRIYHCNTAGSDPCRVCDQPHPGAFQACSYCPSNGHFTRLCPPFFAESASERQRILVHEAAHAAGACGDLYPGEANYPRPNPANNAESYAQFARSVGMTLGPIPMRPHVPTAPP